MRVALLFIDGVGIGPRDPTTNPLARRELLMSRFDDGSGSVLPANGIAHPVDTTFGVAGRPQSATNQSAMYSGQPVPAIIGEHRLGYPDSETAAIVKQHSIVKRAIAGGRTATFANSYPRGYLEGLELPHDWNNTAVKDVVIDADRLRHLAPSASTLAFAAGRVLLRTWDDARADRGLTHDIDGASAADRGYPVPRRTVERAAQIFWELAEDFTLFEHYLADESAHHKDWDLTLRALDTFDRFARAVIERRPVDTAVLIISDHGNAEDLSIRQHTRNPVALLSFGASPDDRVKTLADVGNWVLRLMGVDA